MFRVNISNIHKLLIVFKNYLKKYFFKNIPTPIKVTLVV